MYEKKYENDTRVIWTTVSGGHRGGEGRRGVAAGGDESVHRNDGGGCHPGVHSPTVLALAAPAPSRGCRAHPLPPRPTQRAGGELIN